MTKSLNTTSFTLIDATAEGLDNDSMEKKIPTIAVVIIAKNAANTIAETISSVVKQTTVPNELVVVDNNSTDQTRQIVESQTTDLPYPVVILSGSGSNLSYLRNIGNRSVKSDYIAVLDADDYYDEDTLSIYKNFVIGQNWPDVIYADCQYFNGGINTIKRYPVYRNNTSFIAAILARPVVPFKHSAMIYSRSSWSAIGGYNEDFERQIDIYLMLEFLRQGMRVVKLNEATAVHRRHDGQSTKGRLRSLKRWSQLIDLFETRSSRRFFYKTLRYSSEILKRVLGG